MLSFQMLGMTAPNILMSGGINNLISNIKQLNMQMAAAIIQAEKISRMTSLNGGSASGQVCCQCNRKQVHNGSLVGTKRLHASQASNQSK